MKYNLSLAIEAHNDIDGIGRYIALDNLSAAKKVTARIFKVLDTIVSNPKIGASAAERFQVDTDSLYFVVLPYTYIIFYNIKAQEVKVSRVLDSRRDCMSILGWKEPINTED